MLGSMPELQRLENEQKRCNPKNIGQKKASTYLEIGAAFGGTFFHIKARQKIAVDPNFRFSRKRKIKWVFKTPYNIVAKYYELSSDSYFANRQSR